MELFIENDLRPPHDFLERRIYVVLFFQNFNRYSLRFLVVATKTKRRE